MAHTMTPSTITDGQINKAGDVLRAVLCKNLREHRFEFDSDAVQQVLGNPALGQKWLTVFREMVKAVSVLIVRHIKEVNRTRTPQQMLDALGRLQYTNREVVDSIPRGQGKGADIYFFPIDRDISDDDLEKEYQSNGWVAADPYLVARVNEEDSAFADKHPNFAHWKNAQGRWCYLACIRYGGERGVSASRSDSGWSSGWSVAVVHK